MPAGTLVIYAQDGAAYLWPRCTNVRQAKRELRWTNARGEHRSMALAFIATWHTIEETTVTATFHLTDGTTIDGIDLYSTADAEYISNPDLKARLSAQPHYGVFVPEGHRYIPVADVARIESDRDAARPRSWYDLPMAAGMWAADGRELGA